MAHEFHENFEQGTEGTFDSEFDPGNRFDYPHQHSLPPGIMPPRGAHCARILLGKSSADAYVEKAVSWASGQERWGRFNLLLGNDVQFGNDLDRVTILEFLSSSPEARLVLGRIDPLGIIMAVEMEGESWDDNTTHCALPVGRWVNLEFRRNVDVTFGSISLVLPDVCRITSERKPEGTNTKFRFGAFDQTGDIQGTLYLHEPVIASSRLYADPSAYNGDLSGKSLVFVQSGFAFLGAGEVEHLSLIDGGSNNCRIKIYDTDQPIRLPLGGLRYELAASVDNPTPQSTSRRVPFKSGAYVQLSGTNPQAIVRLGEVESDVEGS